MDVAVDQAGHHHPPAAIHDFCAAGCEVFADLRDRAGVGADFHAGLEGAEFGFEEGEVAEEVTYGTRSRSDLATDDATLHDHSHVLQPP